MMPLLSLPTELLMAIACHLQSSDDINALAQTNRRCYAMFNHYLYVYAASNSETSGLLWAAESGILETVKHFFDTGRFTLPGAAKIMKRLLFLSARYGHHEVAEFVLAHGAWLPTEMEDDCRAAVESAIRFGHIEVIKVLVNNGMNLEFAYWDDNMPLHIAATWGQAEIIKFLINRGVDLYRKGKFGYSALHLAAMNGQEDAVRALLDCGFDPEFVDGKGNRPLHVAAIGGSGVVTRALLDQGADPYQTDGNGLQPLYIAVFLNRESMVTALVDYGVNPDGLDANGNTQQCMPLEEHLQMLYDTILIHTIDGDRDIRDDMEISNCCAPLCVAALLGYEKLARLLLDRGANPNIMDPNGEMPLHLAVKCKHRAVAALLIEKGADPEAKDATSQTPLSCALSHGGHELVEFLLNSGVSIDSAKTEDDYPLFRILEYGHSRGKALLPPNIIDLADADTLLYRNEWQYCDSYNGYEWIEGEPDNCGKVVQRFLENGWKAESQDSFGRNLLHYAVFQFCPSTVRLLIERGVDPTSKDAFNQTPLHLALAPFWTYEEIIKSLLEAGADPDSRDVNGETPLHMAARAGYRHSIYLLVDVGKANMTARDNNGNTPLHLAVQADNRWAIDVIKRLLKLGADPHLMNNDGRSVLDLARERGDREIITLLSMDLSDISVPPLIPSSALAD